MFALAAIAAWSAPAMVEDAATAAYEYDIARDLSNPVAALISVPIQFDYDRGLCP